MLSEILFQLSHKEYMCQLGGDASIWLQALYTLLDTVISSSNPGYVASAALELMLEVPSSIAVQGVHLQANFVELAANSLRQVAIPESVYNRTVRFNNWHSLWMKILV